MYHQLLQLSDINSQTSNSPSCCYNLIKEIRSKFKRFTKQYFTFSRRLLQLNPNLQDTFPSFKGVALEELMNSRSLFLHSQRLMAVVEDAVSSLNDAQEFIEDLTKLGERHLAMSVTEKHLKVG